MLRLLVLSSLPLFAFAQQSVELHQAFLDLQHDGVLMNLSAHPDDEDGSSLAYYRMKYGIKTYSVFFTRGEGGQNETGPELYEELGVLRTAETEAAARIQGTEARFLNFEDFGYSKTATEAFRKWGGKKEVLRRLVYMIRKLKPDILFTNHNTVDGHGHHQAAAITALEAFDAATDSAYFPEQLNESGLTLWQPRKLYFRIFTPGKKTPDVVNNIQEIDSVRGVSYLEIAKRALRMHKTQGMEKLDLSGFSRRSSLWELVRSNSQYVRDTTDFFAGVRLLSDSNLDALGAIHAAISMVKGPQNRDGLLASIGSIQRKIDSLYRTTIPSPLEHRLLKQWNLRLGNLAAALCGVKIICKLEDAVLVPGQKVRARLRAESADCKITDLRFLLEGPKDDWKEISPESVDRKTSTYWHEETRLLTVAGQPHLTIPRTAGLYNSIEWDPLLNTEVEVRLSSGSLIKMYSQVGYDIAAPEVLNVNPPVVRMTSAGRSFSYVVTNHFPHKSAGKVNVFPPTGWYTEGSEFVVVGEDSLATSKVFVRPPENVQPGSHLVGFETEFAADTSVVRVFDVSVPSDIRIGLIKSYDNTLEMACSELGVQHKIFEEEDLAEGNLGQWTTIVVDIRAYLVREDLKKYNARLLEYVKSGGNLVVMYQRDQEWKPEFAPYPFQITRQRVSVEEAPVKVLVPQHQLFTQPNTIGLGDWNGWIQERAVYLPGKVAPDYARLLSSNDPDEPELDTGYLLASYGQGSYIYTSYVWYRQLKEMHPGAFRCFANMISYPMYRK